MQVVGDIETNRLENPDKLWMAVFEELDGDKVWVFLRPDLNPKPLVEFLKGVTKIIGHNFLKFDHKQLRRLVDGYNFNPLDIIDTLIISRLINYRRPSGHSLEALGRWVGEPKIDFDEYEYFSTAMITYCKGDVKTNKKVYNEKLRRRS